MRVKEEVMGGIALMNEEIVLQFGNICFVIILNTRIRISFAKHTRTLGF